jgi:hypothetical protein
LQIQERMGERVERIVRAELDGESLRLILYLPDGTNVRVTEPWRGEQFVQCSYYWLTADNQLKTGWDNAPHHAHLDTFPHHKRVRHQRDLRPSDATRLEEVLREILSVQEEE